MIDYCAIGFVTNDLKIMSLEMFSILNEKFTNNKIVIAKYYLFFSIIYFYFFHIYLLRFFFIHVFHLAKEPNNTIGVSTSTNNIPFSKFQIIVYLAHKSERICIWFCLNSTGYTILFFFFKLFVYILLFLSILKEILQIVCLLIFDVSVAIFNCPIQDQYITLIFNLIAFN